MEAWNYANLWESVAAAAPDRPALIQGPRVVSYRDFDRRANALARRMLEAGVSHQSKVGAYLYNAPEYLESYFAAFKAGLAPFNINYRYGGEELTYLLDNADAEVVVIDPAGESHDHKTDAAGVVRLSSAAPGVYAIRAKHVEADRGGELDGKQYSQTTHFATTSFKIIAPATTAAAESAEALLTGAREHRAVWDNFPGFVAKIEVKLDEETKEGELHVTADGDVELKGIGSFGAGLVDRHLNSLVMHRMPGSQFDNGAAFDGSLSHVLGPRVKLADPQMGSVYRIRDRVVTEVNRAMGKQHFTISVLDVDFNAEGKYMPHAFTVSFWDEKTGDLKLTETVYHEWVRLGKFDLPAQVTVVGCGDKNRRQVLQIVFSDHRLQAGEQAAR